MRIGSALIISGLFVFDAQAQLGLNAGFGAAAQFGVGLQGSGYYGGVQSCPYAFRSAKNAYDEIDEVVEEKKEIVRLQGELKLQKSSRDRADLYLKSLTKKIEKYFDSEIAEFLMSTHIDNRKKCDEYREQKDCSKVVTKDEEGKEKEAKSDAATKTACEAKTIIPDLLKDKWLKSDSATGKGPYCIGSNSSNAGTVHSSICNDTSLRVVEGTKTKSVNVSDCQKTLTEYRRRKIEYEKAQAKYDELDDEIKDRRIKIADAKTRAKIEDEIAKQDDVEGGCEECALAGRNSAYRKPQRDWLSTSVNVLGGLGLAWYGKKIDESAQSYNAQLGYPSYNSYGYPFVTAGISGVINGLAGPGAYGCSGGYGGAGYPYGAGGALGALGALGYGPNGAQGGAFGYPQSMFGSPWGGGMYQPGFGANGALAGPNGGFPLGGLNGQIGLGIPVNGGLGAFAGGGLGAFAGGGLGAFAGGGLGAFAGGGLGAFAGGGLGAFAGGGLGAMVNNPQYQLQMMQQQQLLQQQQQQQQAMYFQAQAQAQMQAYQRQQVIQQQAMTYQQEITSLQSRLQMLYSGAYSGSSLGGGLYGGGVYGGGSLGTGIGIGISGGIGLGIGGGVSFGTGVGTGIYNNTSGTIPGTTLLNGTGTSIRGR